MTRDEFLSIIANLRMAPAASGSRHPHKPLLLLWLLGRAQQGDLAPVAYADVQQPVDDLLAEFGTPAKRPRDRAAKPFFFLENDIWSRHATTPGVELSDSGGRLRQAAAVGAFTADVRTLLQRDPATITAAARVLLEDHFTDSIAASIAAAVGLALDPTVPLPESARIDTVAKPKRDPNFRPKILRQYDHACAMCGWDGRRSHLAVGLAAAHIRWHSQHGPDTPDNGLALCELHHKLFDLGVIGLSENLSIVVADDFTGMHPTTHILAWGLHGQTLRSPNPHGTPPAPEHVRWHTQQVFHGGHAA